MEDLSNNYPESARGYGGATISKVRWVGLLVFTVSVSAIFVAVVLTALVAL